MAMSSFEVMRRAIEFKTPDRLPLRIVYSEESDTVNVDWNYIGSGDLKQRTCYDEWGCLWVRSEEENMGQIKGHPLDDWTALDTYKWPDPHNPDFFLGMEEKLDGIEEKYVISDLFMLLFERMQALRGFENVLTDLYLEGERIEMLADRIVEFDLAIIRNIADRFPERIHGFWMTEDWGSQQNLMINPKLWRDFFKPRYIQIFNAIHDAGWHVWFHCDGKINAIIEDLIEIGVDVLNIMSPLVVGIEEVGQLFSGRICFESSVDIQLSLPVKSPEDLREEAARLLEQWATQEGGFILSIDDGDQMALKISPESKQIMLDIFHELDPWRN